MLRGDGRLAKACAVGGWVALAVAFLGLVEHKYAPSWQPLIVLAAFAHWLLIGAPVAVALFTLARRWMATGVALCCVVLAAASQGPLYVASESTPHGERIRVLQANLGTGHADPGAVVRLVERNRVDVLATEELTIPARQRLLEAGLARWLPYRFDAALPSGGGGLAIWSRYPLSGEVNVPHFELGVLSARLRLQSGQALTVLAVHLLPPYPYPSKEWLAETTRLRRVLTEARQDGAPVLVAGDFNATTDHARFRKLLAAGYRDGAEQDGAGYLATYPTDRWFPPVVAIDHVLTHAATVTNVAAQALPGSDHRALVASVVVPG